MTEPRRRPLSPHLQIYKPQITSGLSILHRMTGIANTIGTLVLVWWLAAAAAGPDAFATANGFLGSIIGQLLLLGWTVSVFYHLCNGIRHLVWDAGRGFDLDEVQASAYLVLGGTVVLTVVTWIFAYTMMG